MPKLRVIIKPPPEPRGEPEQQVAQLRDYLLQMCEELAYLLTHLEADNINDSTFERISEMIPKASVIAPPMDGAGSAGGSSTWARGDHQHPTDTSRASEADLTAHTGNTSNPHSVTKAQVGLGNVANERQYSAQNPPPTPSAADVGAIPTTSKGTAGGVAELDANGHVPSSQLPSYVDDVKEYPSVTDFPIPGESDKIYIALDTDLFYRWGGTVYAPTNPSLALGETSSTAYRGDRGKTAYDHSQVTSGNPHNVTAAEVGARPDTWTPSASDVGAQPTITASGMLKGDGLGGVSAATAGTDYQTPLVAGTDYATPAQIPAVPDPSDAAPQDLGTAAAGSSGDYSREDHVHNLPDAEDIPYDNTGSGLSATDVQAAIDEVARGGGGGGPSPATATPVMDGTGAVGSSLLYAREDHEHPSDTAKQDAITANGILKGDGLGGVSAAVAGTDYQTPLTAGTDYQTPLVAGTDYQTPLVAGTDYQTPLTAGTDYQTPLVAGTDYATPGMIPTVPSAYTSNPAMDGTASPGSSGNWARGNHVHPSDTSRVPVYGLGKNLLDNAYFVGGGSQLGGWRLPINQRRSSSYNDAANGDITIDRWKVNKLSGATITVAVESDGIKLTKTGTVAGHWNQTIESLRLPVGGKCTLSVLITSITYSGTEPTLVIMKRVSSTDTVVASKAISSTGLHSVAFTVPSGADSFVIAIGAVSPASSQTSVYTVGIAAMKLEMGTESTLATQESGTWMVPNAPSFLEEQQKCRRYLFDVLSPLSAYSIAGLGIGTSGTQANFVISTPVTMRAVPTVSMTGAIRVVSWDSGGNAQIVSVTSFEQQYTRLGNGSVQITANASGVVGGRTYILSANNSTSAKLLLSAEL